MSPPSAPIGRHYPDAGDPQAPVEVAVVMPTILRPCVAVAVESVFRQNFAGRIQLLIGVDKAAEAPTHLEAALEQRPDHVSALVLALPYSTSIRHGGVHPATDGGSLRAILSFMANSRYVAYLDDDNSWEPDHLSGVVQAIQGKVWAYSLRMLIDETNGRELAVDRWDSVGPNAGRFAAQGGLVDPNCLLVDKLAAARAFGRWSEGPGVTSDRNFFAALREAPHGRVERATVRYGIRPTNVLNTFLRENTQF
ncbi:MAG TPA: hypothetical protein VJS38_09150 [Phenylobacterium sp.]|uniref:hypothetical protein n=1 Tax=Phenylobacterium sp. TaxID=1871053 RepID=UPI002B4AAA0F|nr:hypothetical protein [Phenylobacterium sp.]HKR88330.1 hypothetical protein [Phenylobacterium sp.]